MSEDAGVVPRLRIWDTFHERLHRTEEASSSSAAASAEGFYSGTFPAEGTRSRSSAYVTFSASESGFPAEAFPAEEADAHAYSGRGGG